MKTADFNRFSVHLPDQCVADCSHQGACDDDVEHWMKLVQLDISPDKLKAELKEYGAWEDLELDNHEDNIRRIIWLAAGNIQEEEKSTR